MRAGELDNRLTFQRPTAARNEYGEASETFADVFTVWGSVSPVAGRELTQARQRQSSMTHLIVIRYRSDMIPTPRWKIEDANDGTVFQIEAVRFPDSAQVEIDAVEQVTGAE